MWELWEQRSYTKKDNAARRIKYSPLLGSIYIYIYIYIWTTLDTHKTLKMPSFFSATGR